MLLESVVLEFMDTFGELMERPCRASCGCLGACDEEWHRLASPSGKKVGFAIKIQVRPIPAENRGRKCRGSDRKKVEGKWMRPRASAGGVSPTEQVASPTPRPRWADLCEEEENERKGMENSSGKSDNTVDSIEAETASELRVKFGALARSVTPCGCDVYRASQKISVSALSQILFDSERRLTCEVPPSWSTVDQFELSVEGGALGFGVSKGSGGLALDNVEITPLGCDVRAGRG